MCLVMILNAQEVNVNAMQKEVNQSPEGNGLKVGDVFPDFAITKLLSPLAGTIADPVQSASFKDKLLIIDFWATNCSGCVAALPKMERLQQQFADQIMVLPVTDEEKGLVTDFWKKNKYTKTLKLPTVVEDKQLKGLFPHIGIPHEVWVYKGKVIGITGHEYVDEYNIKQVLSGNVPNWPVKNDYYAFDAIKQPLFTFHENNPDSPSGGLVTYSAISGYKEKDGASAAGFSGNSGIIRDSVTKTIRTWFVNQPILVTYLTNWSNVLSISSLKKPSFFFDPNQIVWEVDRPERYHFQGDYQPGSIDRKPEYRPDWLRKNAICFEAVYPDYGQSDKDISRSMIDNLNALLGLNARWEKRREKVRVLVRTGKKPVAPAGKTRSAGNPATDEISPSAERDKNAVRSVSELLYKMNQQAGNPYVFNTLKEEVYLNFRVSSLTDFVAVNKVLQPHGLMLKEEERLVDKFVFSKK